MKTPGEVPMPGTFWFSGQDPTAMIIDAIEQKYE